MFDLDGVVTDTARQHARAWKDAFDSALRAHAGPSTPFAAFDQTSDYRDYVDGRPRFDGAQSFLTVRGLQLPEGHPGDKPGSDTVWAVANRKNETFTALLAVEGVSVFPSTLALIQRLKQAGVKTAVVTASRNGARVITAAGIGELFDARVDGSDAAALGLAGKPDPATYLEAVRRLHVSPDRAVVVEDSAVGVRAGRSAGFGLVIGIDRTGDGQALLTAGADLAVNDLAQLPADLLGPRTDVGAGHMVEDSPGGGHTGTGWVLRYDGYDPAREGLREVLCATGNGYLCTRGAAPECRADDVHYPGSYLAGVYNRLTTPLTGWQIEHEHLVNAPNWLPLQFRTDGDDWFRPDTADLVSYRLELDTRTGVLARDLRYRDPAGRHTRVRQRRLVHMGTPHLAALETIFTAEDWSGRFEVRTGIDATVTNSNLPEDAPLAKVHLEPESSFLGRDTLGLTVTTTQSRVRVAMAARTRVYDPDGQLTDLAAEPFDDDPGFTAQTLHIDLAQGRPVSVEKIVAVATSRDPATSEPGLAARTVLADAGRFTDLLNSHQRAWQQLWEHFDLTVDAGDDVALALRLHTFHLLQTISPHTAQLDAGLPARGLHGEGYHGHVFWDELFVFPVLNLRMPALSRALLLYRWRRLDAARRAARHTDHAGAMFPWESGSDGREETPGQLYILPAGRWLPNRSGLQQHVGIAIVYDTWQYYQVTGDVEFLADHGAEMIIEVARYLTSLTAHDPGDGRYGISGVVGPDEYHDAYPDATEPGVRDNAYTNVMTAWVLCRALDVIAVLGGHHCSRLCEQLELSKPETRLWEHISRRMRVPFHDGVISQFDGYEQLREFDFDTYRARYGDLVGIDAVLRADGDSTNRYKLSKQADVLMLLYLLSAEELRELFDRLGYTLDAPMIERTVAYYLARVAHGSSLSRIAHAWVQARADREQSWTLFTDALSADLADRRGGSTRGGVHLAAMAGTVDIALRCYTGLHIRDDTLYLNPLLPAQMHGMHAEVLYRGNRVVIDIDQQHLCLGLRSCNAAPIRVDVNGAIHTLTPGQRQVFPLTAQTSSLPVARSPVPREDTNLAAHRGGQPGTPPTGKPMRR